MSTLLTSKVFSGVGIKSINLAFTIARNTGGVVLQVNTNPALMTLDGDLVVRGTISQIFPGTGSCNTAYGVNALISLTSGSNNSAFGENSLASVVSASNSTAVGCGALQYFTSAGNSAVGWNALQGVAGSSTGTNNNAFGVGSLIAVTTGSNNVAAGNTALSALTTGSDNVAVGHASLLAITTGAGNTALGLSAGSALTVADSGNVCVNNSGTAGDTNTIRLGNPGQTTAQHRTFLAGPITQGGSISAAVPGLLDQQSGTTFAVVQTGTAYTITLPSGVGNIAGRSYQFVVTGVAGAGVVNINAVAATFVGTITNGTPAVVAVSGATNINFTITVAVGDNVLIRGVSDSLWMVTANSSAAAGITAT